MDRPDRQAASPPAALMTGPLLGPSDGWSLEALAHWLIADGRRIDDPVKLLEGVARQLDHAGAGIDRLAIVSRTLHPQLAAWSVYWTRQKGAWQFLVEHSARASDAYLGSPVQFVHDRHQLYRQRVTPRAEEGEHSLIPDLRQEGMTDYAALPMPFGREQTNVLTAATADPAGFTDHDLERLAILASLLSPFVEIIALRRAARGLLDTFVGPRISERIIQGQVKRGDGDRIDAAFWYSDLRGFTQLSQTLPTGEVLDLLNDYFEFCAAAAAARGGEILQFIGDAILIVFEVGKAGTRSQVCESALDAAIDAFDSIAVVNHRRRRAGQAEVRFGLGLHVGTVTHANVGAPNRLAFNVVGPAVNMTARIQSMTKELGEPLLLSAEFAGLVKRPMRSAGRHALRGIAAAEELFAPVRD
jgi:adenylate cyclase